MCIDDKGLILGECGRRGSYSGQPSPGTVQCRLDQTRAVKQDMMQQLPTRSVHIPIPDAVAGDEPDQ